MSEHPALDARTLDLLRDAAEWQLLARLFECPNAQWRIDIARLAKDCADTELRTTAAAVTDDVTDGQYHSVFGPGGPAPPREASYYESLELGSLISELAGYYDAFGYATASQETPDHVAVETGFVAYLTFKAAYAHAQGDDANATIASSAATRFLTDHLSRIATPLAELLSASHLEYLTRASQLLAARVGPSPSRRRLPVLQPISDDDDTVEFVCGPA